MINKKILQKTIEKAEKNGYKFPKELFCFYPISNMIFEYPYVIYHEDFAGSWCLHINEFIFSHDFVKAFWGECKVNSNGESQDEYKERVGWITNWGYHALRWQFHLSKMVLCEEPLKYLEKFL